ncbi:MAG TPA: hypothetical protein VF594_12140 [Rubricoccaceae bacterium]|jgi:hypothetical protein
MADPLTDVLVALEAASQRATYGAVAGYLGAVPYFLMSGRPRDPLHSWVVGTKTGLPTGYGPDETHTDLLRHEHVLRTPDEVADLMNRPAS